LWFLTALRAAAGLEFKAHPRLRHACGYALANKGHDTRAIQGWLGHRSITSTAVYTALAEPVQGLLAQLNSTEAEARPVLARPVAPPGKSPRAPRSSVLLTRLHAPSGDVAEPAYAAKTSHWAAVMKRGFGFGVASARWG
jgi:Phage integrase family